MSKASRDRARQSRRPSYQKNFVIIGILAVLAVAAVATQLLMGWSSKAPAEAAAAGTPGAPVTLAAGTAAANAASGKQLLFFMNPDGYPCQTQLAILDGVADSLSKVARVVYIKTTEPADMQKFETYGIRALPSLVIADQNGRELSRFSPGIQSGDAVLAALTR